MGKHEAKKGAPPRARKHYSRTEEQDVTSMDFSLDDILSEYRVWPETPAAEAEPVPPAQPLAMSPEPDGVSTARVDSQPLQAELMEAFRNEEALPASETPRPAPAEPEEQPPRRRSGRKRFPFRMSSLRIRSPSW